MLPLIVLVPAWTLVVMLVIQPESLMLEPNMGKRFLWWVGVPLLLVAAAVGWRWQVVSSRAAAAPVPLAGQSSAEAQAGPASEQARREYVLEVIGLGVTLDRYRQGALWDALKQGHPQLSIREQDPKKYPWSAREKEGVEGGRIGDTLENGANFTPMYWGVPSFYAGSPHIDPKLPAHTPVAGMVAGATSSGMGWHLFVTAPWELSERPDRLLEKVFAFFDQYPDVPYVILSADDGLYFRNLWRPRGSPELVKDGHYVPDRPDASALFVLARRERVSAVRPFVYKDADYVNLSVDQLKRRGYAWRLGMSYHALQRSVPKVEGGSPERHPTIAEWLPAAHAFTQRDDIYPKGFSALAGDLNPLADGHPSRDYKPSPWFPLPWNEEQLQTFDKLPTLGYLHRPVFVKTVDADGQPLARRDARAAALAAGWQEALQTLPEAERKSAPARIVAATGGPNPQATEQTIALTRVLGAWAEQGGPELDPGKATQWINTDSRLGNTGAATWFVQMAIGVMGSYREGGTSAAINLRDPLEASIVMITPPGADKRKNQQHPKGGDVFQYRGTPAVDPSNYQQP